MNEHGAQAYDDRKYLSAFVAFMPRSSAFHREVTSAVRGFFDAVGVEVIP
jgi:hypothetical protein